jgi:hypothetical protein
MPGNTMALGRPLLLSRDAVGKRVCTECFLHRCVISLPAFPYSLRLGYAMPPKADQRRFS